MQFLLLISCVLFVFIFSKCLEGDKNCSVCSIVLCGREHRDGTARGAFWWGLEHPISAYIFEDFYAPSVISYHVPLFLCNFERHGLQNCLLTLLTVSTWQC